MSTTVQINKTQIFQEITEHLMTDDRPSDYIKNISNREELQGYPFSLLWKLKNTEQSKKYHPEGSVWNHTLLVLDEAAEVRDQSREKEVFMWTALLHDIGKPPTTRVRNGKITSYDHDIVGERLCKEFLKEFNLDENFITKVASMVRYHMHMLYILKDLPHGDMKGLRKNVDAHEIALLCRCDRMGRTGVDREAEEEEYIKFLKVLQK